MAIMGTTNSVNLAILYPQIHNQIKDTTIPDFHVSISKAFCIPSATGSNSRQQYTCRNDRNRQINSKPFHA
jgi:hypothetical protein